MECLFFCDSGVHYHKRTDSLRPTALLSSNRLFNMETLELNIETPEPILWDPISVLQPEFDSLFDLSWTSYPETDFQLGDGITTQTNFANSVSFSPNTSMSGNEFIPKAMQSWTLPDSTSAYSRDLDHCSSVTRNSEGSTSFGNRLELDRNSTTDLAMTPEKDNVMPDLEEDSEDSEDWAGVNSDLPSPPLPFSYKPDDDRHAHNTSETCTDKKKRPPLSMRKEKQQRTTRGNKKQHNTVEQKYRHTINSKLAELDHWLSDYQSESGTTRPVASKQRTKGAILTDAFRHLQHLDRCKEKLEKEKGEFKSQNAKLEVERKEHKVQILKLKQSLLVRSKQLEIAHIR